MLLGWLSAREQGQGFPRWSEWGCGLGWGDEGEGVELQPGPVPAAAGVFRQTLTCPVVPPCLRASGSPGFHLEASGWWCSRGLGDYVD